MNNNNIFLHKYYLKKKMPISKLFFLKNIKIRTFFFYYKQYLILKSTKPKSLKLRYLINFKLLAIIKLKLEKGLTYERMIHFENHRYKQSWTYEVVNRFDNFSTPKGAFFWTPDRSLAFNIRMVSTIKRKWKDQPLSSSFPLIKNRDLYHAYCLKNNYQRMCARFECHPSGYSDNMRNHMTKKLFPVILYLIDTGTLNWGSCSILQRAGLLVITYDWLDCFILCVGLFFISFVSLLKNSKDILRLLISLELLLLSISLLFAITSAYSYDVKGYLIMMFLLTAATC
jgi:NADH:ubiquinone oxidoreductase subunit K